MKLQHKHKKKLARLLSATLATLTLVTSIPLQSFAENFNPSPEEVEDFIKNFN